MKLAYIIELSWKNLMNRKIRSILTISGVIIGIAAITFLISIGYGLERMTTSKISSKDTLYVFDVNLENSDLTEIDQINADKIKELDNVEKFEPGLSLAGRIATDKAKSDVIIEGYNNEYMTLSDIRTLRGAKFNDSDSDKIIVTTGMLKSFEIPVDKFQDIVLNLEVQLSHNISPAVAGDQETKKIENLKIVGLIDDDESAVVILPYDSLKKEIGAENFNVAKVKVKNKDIIQESRTKIEQMGFGTNYVGDTITQITSFFTVFRYIVGGFGFVAMLVAILGMFNTLTVSLLERTREIGVLKSNGALKKDIWRLFLTEALAISIVGGIFGIIFGISLGEGVNIVFNHLAIKNGSEAVDFFYTPPYFIVLVLVSTFITGFVTGYYPSKRATKINALDALKYE